MLDLAVWEDEACFALVTHVICVYMHVHVHAAPSHGYVLWLCRALRLGILGGGEEHQHCAPEGCD